jgi:hypothetical protein
VLTVDLKSFTALKVLYIIKYLRLDIRSVRLLRRLLLDIDPTAQIFHSLEQKKVFSEKAKISTEELIVLAVYIHCFSSTFSLF